MRLQRRQRVEKLLRDLDVLAVDRRCGAAEQQIAGVGAGMLIKPVNARDDAVSFIGVGGGRKPRQQSLAPGVFAVSLRSGLCGRRRRGSVCRARKRRKSQQTEKDEERPTRHNGEPRAAPRRGQNTITTRWRVSDPLSPDAP